VTGRDQIFAAHRYVSEGQEAELQKSPAARAAWRHLRVALGVRSTQ
jgi:hypothetical protein